MKNDSFFRTLNEVTKKEGDKLVLECKGGGDPKPDAFRWTFPDGKVQDGAKLNIGLFC